MGGRILVHLFLLAGAACATDAGRVAELRGALDLGRGPARFKALDGQEIRTHDRLRTAAEGRASLDLGGLDLRLEPGTSLALVPHKCAAGAPYIAFDGGRLRATVRKGTTVSLDLGAWILRAEDADFVLRRDASGRGPLALEILAGAVRLHDAHDDTAVTEVRVRRQARLDPDRRTVAISTLHFSDAFWLRQALPLEHLRPPAGRR